jgi:hypothetical protein
VFIAPLSIADFASLPPIVAALPTGSSVEVECFNPAAGKAYFHKPPGRQSTKLRF